MRINRCPLKQELQRPLEPTQVPRVPKSGRYRMEVLQGRNPLRTARLRHRPYTGLPWQQPQLRQPQFQQHQPQASLSGMRTEHPLQQATSQASHTFQMFQGVRQQHADPQNRIMDQGRQPLGTLVQASVHIAVLAEVSVDLTADTRVGCHLGLTADTRMGCHLVGPQLMGLQGRLLHPLMAEAWAWVLLAWVWLLLADSRQAWSSKTSFFDSPLNQHLPTINFYWLQSPVCLMFRARANCTGKLAGSAPLVSVIIPVVVNLKESAGNVLSRIIALAPAPRSFHRLWQVDQASLHKSRIDARAPCSTSGFTFMWRDSGLDRKCMPNLRTASASGMNSSFQFAMDCPFPSKSFDNVFTFSCCLLGWVRGLHADLLRYVLRSSYGIAARSVCSLGCPGLHMPVLSPVRFPST